MLDRGTGNQFKLGSGEEGKTERMRQPWWTLGPGGQIVNSIKEYDQREWA